MTARFFYDFNSPYAYLAAAREAGVDEAAIRDGLDDPAIKAELRERTDAAVAEGIDGIPTIVVGERRFWGDDHLEDAAAYLARA